MNFSETPGWLRSALCGVAGLLAMAVHADSFNGVYYSPVEDQLVVQMAYRGTNPDHTFSLSWGECRDLDDGSHEMAVEVVDSQGQDAERADFTKTTAFDLADLTCRPVKLTLRTAPRFVYTVQIPART